MLQARQVGISKHGETEPRAGKIGLTKIGSLQICPDQVRAPEIRIGDDPYSVRSCQISLHQIGFMQIGNNAWMALPPCIPFAYASVEQERTVTLIGHCISRILAPIRQAAKHCSHACRMVFDVFGIWNSRFAK